jgi:GGDEF domain-containing protein
VFEALEFALLVAAVAIAVWRPRRLVVIPSSDRGDGGEAATAAAIGASESELPDAFPDRATWAERIQAEAIRCGRYDRSGAVVIVRLEAFEELLAAASAIDGRRLCRAVVASLRRSTRGFDVVFGDETGTFRVLLVEADERAARAFIDRIAQGALRPWLETINRDVRLTAVWATTSELTDLPAADRLAESRLTGVEDGWIRSAFVLRA